MTSCCYHLAIFLSIAVLFFMLLIICHVQILRIFVVTNILYMQPFFLHASCQLLIKVFFIHIQSVVDYILHHSSQLIDKY